MLCDNAKRENVQRRIEGRGTWVHYLVHEIEWNYEVIRKRTLNITVFDVRQVEIRYCGASAYEVLHESVERVEGWLGNL